MLKEISSWEELYEYIRERIDRNAMRYGNQHYKTICMNPKRVKIQVNTIYEDKYNTFWGTMYKLGEGCIEIKLKKGKWRLGFFRIVYPYAELNFRATTVEVYEEGSAIIFRGYGLELYLRKW